MKKFLWINPSILRKDSSQHIQLSDGFHTIEATNKAIQPIIDRTNNYRFYKQLRFYIYVFTNIKK